MLEDAGPPGRSTEPIGPWNVRVRRFFDACGARIEPRRSGDLYLAKSQLAEYEAKRDFAKTGEPRGRGKVPGSKQPRFVIQKHAATRLHYDLRLELDGVFKSWAVTKGPSLDPHDKRLAVEVEDHPLDYGDFEGTILKGQYGGGTVQLWDRGRWEYEGSGGPEEALRKGELKFKLDGKRLKGSWVLVRMRGDKFKGKRNSWLLIKHRDEFERKDDGNALLKEDRSIASGRSMAAIAAGKGRSPKPFMRSHDVKLQPNAVWDSNTGDAAELRAEGKTTKNTASGPTAKKPTGKKAGCCQPSWRRSYARWLNAPHRVRGRRQRTRRLGN